MSLPEATIQNGTPEAGTAPLMELQGIKQYYPVHRHLPIGPRKIVKALDGVDLAVRPGETLGVIGESGCGKSTLARVMSGLEKPTEGRVLFRGQDINELKGAEKRDMRRNIQLIFQDPYSSLNPRMTVEELVGEPFAIHSEIAPRAGRRSKIRELLELVGLNPDHADRYPHNFSGGQQQRIGIARGIALNPQMLICDEPVSALDVSVRAQIVNLLDTLQHELGLSYLFIAHDLQIVRHISDRVATMYLGKVVELGNYDDVYDHTGHPYTQALLSAAPELRKNDGTDRERIVLQGDPPSPIDPPAGCRFHTRCPLAQEICVTKEPEPVEIAGTHAARCHFAETVSAQ